MKSCKTITKGIFTAVAVITCVGVYKRIKENNPDGIKDCKSYPTEISKAGVEFAIDVTNDIMDYAPEIKETAGVLIDDLVDFVDGTLTLFKIWCYDLLEAIRK